MRVKNLKKNFARIQKERKYRPRSSTLPLENTLGFKGIQNSQVLEV